MRLEGKGVEKGIYYTGAENGSRIGYPGRVGTVDLEKGAKVALARRLADNSLYDQPAIGRTPFVPTPPECRRPSIPKLPAIDVDQFCDTNGMHSSLTVYPNNIR